MKKLANVVMLPTEKASKITKEYLNDKDNLFYFPEPIIGKSGKNQHLYFIINEKIKEGDWVFGTILKDNIALVDYDLLCDITKDQLNVSKIIATTNDSLMVYNNRSIMKPLPRPSNEFLKAYCEAYNSNPITEINIEYENIYDNWKDQFTGVAPIGKTIKIAPDNTITISKVEEKTYTRYEVEILLKRSFGTAKSTGCYLEGSQVNDWIKQNLK